VASFHLNHHLQSITGRKPIIIWARGDRGARKPPGNDYYAEHNPDNEDDEDGDCCNFERIHGGLRTAYDVRG
jgi:hypothetical protein